MTQNFDLEILKFSLSEGLLGLKPDAFNCSLRVLSFALQFGKVSGRLVIELVIQLNFGPIFVIEKFHETFLELELCIPGSSCKNSFSSSQSSPIQQKSSSNSHLDSPGTSVHFQLCVVLSHPQFRPESIQIITYQCRLTLNSSDYAGINRSKQVILQSFDLCRHPTNAALRCAA